MRTAFINALYNLAKTDERIFLLCGDLGYSVLEQFAEQFPNQFLNVGIAEQNMTGIAVGLAMEGYVVFIYSIGNFPTLRCMEQIRYDVCYHQANIKIIAVGGGYTYGPLGTSHHTTEELGMLRIIPNMIVCAPGDPKEAYQLTQLIAQYTGPCYVRLSKSGEPNVHQITPDVNFGKMLFVKQGKKIVVLSTGSILKYAADFIEQQKQSWGLWSVPFIKPLDYETLASIATEYQYVITIEEHQSNGGFGSAILEALHDLLECRKIKILPLVRRIAIQDEFIPTAGSQEYLREKAGLCLRCINFD